MNVKRVSQSLPDKLNNLPHKTYIAPKSVDFGYDNHGLQNGFFGLSIHLVVVEYVTSTFAFCG